MPVKYGSLPFKEAIKFFRGKVNVPTAAWTDIWNEEHDVGFVVAGATKADLISDLRGAVDKVQADGKTLEWFRKNFNSVVEKHGWSYKGGRNWRTRVIYDTNLRQAYNAGRYKQMKAASKTRPYWRYRVSSAVEKHRPEHLAWDGLILPHDDPWFDTHTPQNGWGCKCRIETLSERDLKRLGKESPDTAPEIEWEEKTVGVRGPTPRTVSVPKGIDPGFGYAPGKSRLANVVDLSMERIPAHPAPVAAASVAGRLKQARILSALQDGYNQWVDDILAHRHAASGGRRVIGALSPQVVDGLAAQGIKTKTAAISIDQREVTHLIAEARKGHKALSEAMVRELPRHLAKAGAVIWDAKGKHPALLYVFSPKDDSRKGRIAVRVNFHKKGESFNAIRSGALVLKANLEQPGMVLLEGKL
ncbi:MAG: phage minor head protein [Chromatiales bacterium]|nr:hypothetical protein [Gammaproteobacteria bacterium]